MNYLTRIKFRHVIIGSVLMGVGLGLGSIATLFMLSNNHPTLIVEDKWKTITTVPINQPVLGHSSLNPDELNHLLQMQGQPSIAGTATDTTTSSTTSTTTKATTSTTVAPTTTSKTQPPSTLPPSSTTLTSGTTTSATNPPTTNPPTTAPPTTNPPTTVPPTTVTTQASTTTTEPVTTSSTN